MAESLLQASEAATGAVIELATRLNEGGIEASAVCVALVWVGAAGLACSTHPQARALLEATCYDLQALLAPKETGRPN